MEFGVLKVASVISRSLHSQESHLRVHNVRRFTHPVLYSITICIFDCVISYQKIMNGLLELRSAGLRWSGLAMCFFFPSSCRLFKFINLYIRRIE